MHTFFNNEVEGFDSLAELALDLYWYWNHSADEVWNQLDPVLWKRTYNPWVVLQTVSRDQLRRALDDPVFRKKVDDLLRTKASRGRISNMVSAPLFSSSADLSGLF